MSNKGETKTAAPASSRRNAAPAYDLFDSLRQARLKAKQSRPRRPSPTDGQPQEDARHDEE
jgi:hypothetical protein